MMMLHLGVRIPLGFATLDEPRRPVALFVEGTIALALTGRRVGCPRPKDLGVGGRHRAYASASRASHGG
jgi:hypothetical protein